MRRRDRNAFGKGLGPISKAKCLKITTRTVAIRKEPGKFHKILCQLTQGIYVPSDMERQVEGVLWYKLPYGWLCSMDSNGYESCVTAPDSEGQRMWAAEFDKRRRIAGAITAMLTRSYSLDNARRVAKSIFNYINSDQMGPMINLPDVSVEDLMVGLSSCAGLRQSETLEFIKIAACQQCNPPKALRDIAADVMDLINMRPTKWVTSERNVLETMDVRSKNDQFVMSAARGDTRKFEDFLAIGQELAAVHSELKYTALHAAADFGQDDIAKRLIGMGLSTDIRDARKGQTPLHFSGQGGRSHICQLLLAAGADRSIFNYSGKLAYELAADQGFLECAEILKTPPPAVQFVAVIDSTTRTISLHWEPPAIDPLFNARISEYTVEWTPVEHYTVVGHGQRFVSKGTSFTLRGLRPATGHGFVILCNSPAGLSEPSSKIIQFTKPAPPDRPPTVEMLRVTTNGVFLVWAPPKHTNGSKIDRYQLELVETSKGMLIEEREAAAREAKIAAKLARAARKRAARLAGMGHVTPLRQGGSANASSLGSLDSVDDLEEEEDEPEQVEDEEAGWDEDEHEGPEAALAAEHVSLSSSLKDEGSVARPQAEDDSGNDRNHRIFKVAASTLTKQCMGLEIWKPYQCRVRCHNALGYSAWSDWIGPVTPQPGVYVLDFDRENRSLRVGWFKPMLSALRKVTGYEVQLCNVMGPLLTAIPVFAEKADKARIIARNVGLAFHTLSSDVTINEFVVGGLKAGSKYQVRVRCQVDKQWLDWALGMLSDTILMPACAPERPFGLRPALRNLGGIADEAAATEGGQEMPTGGPSAAEGLSTGMPTIPDSTEDAALTITSTTAFVAADYSSFRPPQTPSATDYEITHETIQLQWTNGINNGSPVVEYQLEYCKVREYRSSDVAQAEIAAGVEALSDLVLRMFEGGQAALEAAKEEEGNGEEKDEDEEDKDEDEDGDEELGEERQHRRTPKTPPAEPTEPTQPSLKWTNYTHRAALLGPQAFLVRGLFPGGSYIFRLRVRNEHGFSPWSLASSIITTFPCLPVGKPQIVKTQPYHVYVRWNEQGDGRFMGLTNIEYDVEIGKIPAGESQQTYHVPWLAAEVSLSPEYGRPTPADKEKHAAAVAAHSAKVAAHAKAKEDLAAFRAAQAALKAEDDDTDEEEQEKQRQEDPDEADDEGSPGPTPPLPKFVGVMLNNLSPATDFCCRVRVRTVLGWSTWSETSDSFRTMSQNA